MRAPRATINLEALEHNLWRIKQLAPDSKVISVIKANAYGHGVLAVARALAGSDGFAVARLDEACDLRDQGIEKKIILLEGVCSAEEYRLCFELQLIPVIHSIEQFLCLQQFVQGNSALISQQDNHQAFEYWLKFDTGMHRLGLSVDELTQLLEISGDFITGMQSTCRLSGVMSHFSCADERDNPLNDTQLLQFDQQYHQLSSIAAIGPHSIINSVTRSMANSAAILSRPDACFDWIRPGIMLYGVSPFESSKPMRTGLDEGLKPVMTLSSAIIAIKHLKAGDAIGYGASWCCPHDMRVAVIAIGYGDGYPRHAPTGTPVLIHGTKVPLVGRVSMDMITVDLSPLEQKLIPCKIGDRAILWGDGLPIEYISQKSATIAYELLCQITQRVCFEYE